MLNFILNVVFQGLLLVFKLRIPLKTQLLVALIISAVSLAILPFTVGYIAETKTAFIITAIVITLQGIFIYTYL